MHTETDTPDARIGQICEELRALVGEVRALRADLAGRTIVQPLPYHQPAWSRSRPEWGVDPPTAPPVTVTVETTVAAP